MAEEGVETLRAMFPDASTEALQAILEVANGDVSVATNFLLSDDAEAAGGGGSAAPGGQAAGEGADDGEGEDDDDGEGEGDGEGEADEDAEAAGTDDEDDAEDEEEMAGRAAKRLKTVEPTPEESLVGKKANFVQFDQRPMLRKTHLVRRPTLHPCASHRLRHAVDQSDDPSHRRRP